MYTALKIANHIQCSIPYHLDPSLSNCIELCKQSSVHTLTVREYWLHISGPYMFVCTDASVHVQEQYDHCFQYTPESDYTILQFCKVFSC